MVLHQITGTMSHGTASDHRHNEPWHCTRSQEQDHNLNCYSTNLLLRFHCHVQAYFPQHLTAKHSLYTTQYNENPQCCLFRVREQKVISNKHQHTHTSLNHHFTNILCIATCFNPSGRITHTHTLRATWVNKMSHQLYNSSYCVPSDVLHSNRRHVARFL